MRKKSHSNKVKDSVDTRKVLRFILDEMLNDKNIFWTVLLVPTSSLVLYTALPYISSQILGQLAQHGSNFDWQKYLISFALTAAIGVVANRIGFMILMKNQARSMHRIHMKTVENLLQKSSGFFANNMSGKIVSDAIRLPSAFMQFQDLTIINILPFIINIAVGVTIVSLKSWQLGLGLFAMALVTLGSAIHASNNRSILRKRRHEATRELHGDLADIITNSGTVKMFAREMEEIKNQEALSSKLTKYRVADWRLVAINGSNRIIGLLIAQIVVMALVIATVSKDPSNIPIAIFALTFTVTMTNKLFDISTLIRMFETAITEASPMVEILSESPEIQDIGEASTIDRVEGNVNFDKVNFKYLDSKSNQLLFNNFSLDIPKGQKIGLVGHSGGGKTTITKLLLRLMDIQGGTISIDGKDISTLTQQSLRSQIAYVPQEPILFHRSVAQNIGYGNPDATIEGIKNAAKLAYADEFIKGLPDKYNTIVGERGVKLSGGQRQRIAIARAILKDAPVLVLDEATSALDSESESLIQKALQELMKTRTSIVIAHRLSTIHKMDRIIVIDNGRITESGTHKDLLKKGDLYSELWAHQSGGFIKEEADS